jgi:hypothetical protein
MSLILAAVLLIGGLLVAALLAIGIPALFGLMAYDTIKAPSLPKSALTSTEVADTRMRIAFERGTARAFVIGGGIFWSVAAFAGLYSFLKAGVGNALLGAFFPLVAVLATLAVGWYFERVAAISLAIASLAVVAWGVIYQFEAGVWGLMIVALVGPMMTAAVLFWMARRDQEAFELAMSTRPELVPAVSGESTI